jgi:hypothetical protein
MRAFKVFFLAAALLAAGWSLPAARAGSFTWTAGTDVTASLLNSEDADAGVIQNGPTLWVETSLYPLWYRFSGTTLDNLTAQPVAVRDPTTFNQPNKDDA